MEDKDLIIESLQREVTDLRAQLISKDLRLQAMFTASDLKGALIDRIQQQFNELKSSIQPSVN